MTSPVRTLTDEFHERWLTANPFAASMYGVPGYDHLVPDASVEGDAAWRTFAESVLARAREEVGPEFYERFVARNADWARFFTPSGKEGHYLFDLPNLTVSRLAGAGVKAENLDICTYADEDRFFSYRRTTHRKEPDYGRQISAIMLREG